MGLIGFGHTYGIESYKALCSDDKWDALIELFRQENARIFQVAFATISAYCLMIKLCSLSNRAGFSQTSSGFKTVVSIYTYVLPRSSLADIKFNWG